MNTGIDYGSIFSTISSQATNAISAILPEAAGVAAVVLAVGIGWKLFKRLTGR